MVAIKTSLSDLQLQAADLTNGLSCFSPSFFAALANRSCACQRQLRSMPEPGKDIKEGWIQGDTGHL